MKNWIWSIAILLALISARGMLAQQHDAHQNRDKSMDKRGGGGRLVRTDGEHGEDGCRYGVDEATGDSDVDLVKLMFPHHQAAIDIAESELMHGKDPQMRRLAQEIVTDQQSEIESMQPWLKRTQSCSLEDTTQLTHSLTLDREFMFLRNGAEARVHSLDSCYRRSGH